MKKYFDLLRIKQYIKNILIFVPFFFSGKFNNGINYITLLISFVSFSLMASTVYIINDINDIEYDKLNKNKKNKPITSGIISIKQGYIISAITFIISIILSTLLNNKSTIILFLYYILNILYSNIIKNIKYLDIITLSIFYTIRLKYGAIIWNIDLSIWLYLLTSSVALYFGSLKRLNEYQNTKKSRKVLNLYTKKELNITSIIFGIISILIYSLWVILKKYSLDFNIYIIYSTIIIVILIIIRYYNITVKINKHDGNPVNTLLKDILLQIYSLIYLTLLIIATI